MLIQVILTGGNSDYVEDSKLDSLIESKEIVKFKRSTGWVTIGTDPMRVNKRDSISTSSDKIAADNPMLVRAYRKDNQ